MFNLSTLTYLRLSSNPCARRSGFLCNAKGFTIIEILMAMGIASVISLAMTYAIVSSMDGLSHQRNFTLADDASSVISSMMGDPNYCGLHFNGTTVPVVLPATVKTNIILKDMTGAGALGPNTLFSVGGSYQNALKVEDFKLVVETPMGANRFLGALQISFKGNSGYSTYFSRKIPVSISTDATNKINSCSRSLQPSMGPSIGVFSKNCTDYAAKGWASKDQCLQDGKWHLIYSNTAAGVPSFGVINDLLTHVEAGAEVKVGHPPGTFGMSAVAEKCSSHTYVGGVFLCIPTFRFGVDNIALKTGKPQTGLYYSDGVIVLMNNSTVEDARFNAPMDWYIKY